MMIIKSIDNKVSPLICLLISVSLIPIVVFSFSFSRSSAWIFALILQVEFERSRLITQMKHILKIMSLLVAISAIWIGLLSTSVVPQSYALLLPVYCVVALGCYGLLMVGVGLMRFPTCPQEAVLLHKDIAEAKEYLKSKGVDVGSQ